VLWRRFTYCPRLHNTNRPLLASASSKALHLGYVYVSTAYFLVRMYSKMLHWQILYVSAAYFLVRIYSKMLPRQILYVSAICSFAHLHSMVLCRGNLYVSSACSFANPHSIRYIEVAHMLQQLAPPSTYIQMWYEYAIRRKFAHTNVRIGCKWVSHSHNLMSKSQKSTASRWIAYGPIPYVCIIPGE
jgi:hypothetical protein